MGYLSDSIVFAEYAKTPEQSVYDFYRCYKCGRVFSREQELRAFSQYSDSNRAVCICGSSKYSPGWPVFLDWLRPSIIRYTFKLFLARAIAPWCEKYMPSALPYIERLVRFN